MDLLPELRSQVARSLDDFVILSNDGQVVPDAPDKWTRLHWWKVFQKLVRASSPLPIRICAAPFTASCFLLQVF